MLKNLDRNTVGAILMSFIFAVLIYFVAYETPRTSFNQFILLYMAAFAIFYMIWLNRQQWSFKSFLILAILIRLILLFAVPELSNDFYRFIWDGELINMGINPYAHVPNELISQGPIYSEMYMRMLYHGMGDLSASNYSCYPVVNQIFFFIPTYFFDSIAANVICFKVIMILADIGIILIGRKILILLKQPVHLIWLFALNPFIILEFTGNLHFEGVMIFFILLGIYYVMSEKWIFGAVFFGLAIQVKLLPIMLIPFLYKRLKIVPTIGFTALIGIVVILLGLVLINEAMLANFMSSINLYFETFEFNASLIYLFREYSMAKVGYNELFYYGPLLSKIATVLILSLAILRSYKNEKDIFKGMLFALVIYYLFATTVHPWYISLVLIFSIFSNYKFGLVWSLVIMLSYFAYSQFDFQENLLLISLEYIMVGVVLIVEILRNTKKDNFGLGLKSFFTLKND